MTDVDSGGVMTSPSKLLDRPALDWLVIGTITLVAAVTPLQRLFTYADIEAQRSTMASVASVLGTVAAFTVAALFFYAGLDNPSTQRVREAWGGYLSRTFLGSLAVIIVAALVCGFTGLAAPSVGATVTFFAAITAALVKLGRLTLVVSALLRGQRHDDSEKPDLHLR